MSEGEGARGSGDAARARAVVASATRGGLLFILSVCIILAVFRDGLNLYDKLPARIPTHFGLGGRPDAWSQKSVFSVFGTLLVPLFVLILMAVVSAHRDWWNLPNRERIRRLSAKEQEDVLAPIGESTAWLAAGMAVGFALLTHDSWLVAMHLRTGLSLVRLFVPMAIGIAALVAGLLVTQQRLKTVQGV